MFNFLSLLVGALVIWVIKQFISYYISRHVQYPPGPKPKPFIGNALDFPNSQQYEAYVEWGKRYNSGILYASALGNKVLIINKLEDADELLDRRARLYSDRPMIPIVELTGWGGNVALLHYGKSWRLSRKLCQQSFRAEAARDFHPLLLKKTHEMLYRLLVDPDHFDEHSKMMSISVPMITMYGYEVESFEDPCIVAAEESIASGGDLLLPGKSWINTFPILGYVPPWFPGATTRRIAKKAREINRRVQDIPFEFVEKNVAEGTEIPSFVSRFLKRQLEGCASKEEEEAVRNIAWTVYSGASDTMVSATGTFFYAMTIHPEIQRKAQSEIDRVVDAIYREVLRFGPPVPMAVAHSLMEDDYYKGYFIPKGTMILPDIWAMTCDESIYPEPLQFKPERFLDANGNLNDDDRVLAYGFGRRICVGKHIGSDTVHLDLSTRLLFRIIELIK